MYSIIKNNTDVLYVCIICILILVILWLLMQPCIEPFIKGKDKDKDKGKLPISAGILTYFAPKTLHHTLETYKTSGFLDSVEDVFVIIQKSDRQVEEKKVCDSFGIRCVLLETNGKMASGFRAIYDNAKMDIILPLENDFAVYTDKDTVQSFLLNAYYFLEVKGFDVVRGRSRKNGGVPNYAYERHKDESPHTFINNRFLSECIYWVADPELFYPSKIQRIPPEHGSESWYLASSSSCNYTNNPFLCKKEFFERAILPHLVDGEDIETRLFPIWEKESYQCVFGPGLFTHDRSYDGHS